jgi:hypothetical protein
MKIQILVTDNLYLFQIKLIEGFFTYLSILLIINDVSCPILNDQLSQLCWQESNLW